jgi:hypothetical protein
LAKITIDQLPVAIGLTGLERVPIAKNSGSGFETEYTTVGSISDAATQAEYVLAGTNFNLPFARILTAAAGQTTITDGGAGGNITLGLANTGITAGSYGDSTHILSVSVDAKGRITSISEISLNTSFQTYLQGLPTSLPSQPNLPWWNGGVLSLS